MEKLVRKGDKVALDGSSGNHGCTNYAIFSVVRVNRQAGTAELICCEAQSCSSCWQVGHSDGYVFFAIGDREVAPISELLPGTRDDYCHSSCEWQWCQ